MLQIRGAETGAEMIPFTAVHSLFRRDETIGTPTSDSARQVYIADTVIPFRLRGAEITSVGGAVGKHMPIFG